jgi:hypothetical protein
LFSYFSKLNKEIQANQKHQGGAATQIFQIRFLLVYLRLLKGDKSDSSIFTMIIFEFLLFFFLLFELLLLIWVNCKGGPIRVSLSLELV